MYSTYLTSALRNFLKNKIFSFINLSGLVLGITACLIILQYAYHEMSYDNFHQDKEDIYRVQADDWAAGPAAVGPEYLNAFPEVDNFVTLRGSFAALTVDNLVYKEPRAYYATSSFFDIFSYELIKRSDSLLLEKPNNLAISESTAKKYFGDEEPIGKTMVLNGLIGRRNFTVTGVFADPPENTHLKADVLFSYEAFVARNGEGTRNNWGWWGFYTYLKLKPGSDPVQFQEKMAKFEVERQENEDDRIDLSLMPVDDIHLKSQAKEEFEVNGSDSIVYGLLVVAAFILVIAWLNFISLSSAKAVNRAREIGIRKVMGSSRPQLIIQFLLESVLINTLAAGLGFTFAILLLPYFESIAGKPLTSNLFQDPLFWIAFPIVVLAGAVLSGLYPALIMSGYKSIDTLKGRFKSSSKGQVLRKSIVIFQFAISIVLIVSTLIVHNQISFMQDKDLGLNIDQTIVVDGPSMRDSTYTSRYRAFKTELLRQSAIKSISTSSDIPGKSLSTNNAGGVRLDAAPAEDGFQFRLIDIDYDFVPSYELEMVAGRNFSKERNTTIPPILMNEKGVEYMGLGSPEEAIGSKIFFWGQTRELVGVLKDYHQDSPKSDYQSLIYRPLWDVPSWQTLYSIKVEAQSIRDILPLINETFDNFYPGNAFNYTFLDDQYESQYRSEKLFNTLFNLFSGLAIFIACLGLFGLSMYTVFQRMNEIGIRKVLGASSGQITFILSNQFVKLIALAVVLGIPASWLIMRNWLSDFAFRIDMTWWHFGLPIVALLGIALLTVYQQVNKGANSNPVDTLRQE